MTILRGWGMWIFVLQAILAAGAYYSVGSTPDDCFAEMFALVFAGVVPLTFLGFAIFDVSVVVAALALASLSGVLALFCFLGSSEIFTSVFIFISGICSFIAAATIRHDESESSRSLWFLFGIALPLGIGVAVSLISRFLLRRRTASTI